MARFMKSDVMANANTVSKLMSVDVADKNNLAHASKVDVGFCADKTLKNLVSTKKISEKIELEFRMDCRKCLQSLAGNGRKSKDMHKQTEGRHLQRTATCL